MARKSTFRINLRGFGAKIMISHITLALFVIVFASAIIFGIFYSYIRMFFRNELLRQVKVVCEMETSAGSTEHDPERMRQYEYLTDSKLMYFDSDYIATHLVMEDGDISVTDEWWDGDLRRMRILDALDQYFFARILSGDAIADIRTFRFTNNEIIFAGAPVKDAEGSVTGGIVLMQSMRAFNAQVSLMLKMLLSMSAVSVIIAIFISHRRSKKLSAPLMEMTEGARRLTEGRYGERINIETNDELGELASTLNTLSSRMRVVVNNLREERDKLDLVMNGIGEGIIAVDWYMHVMHCNQSFLAMMEMEACPEKPPENAQYTDILRRSLKNGARENAAWSDSTGRRLQAIASPLHSDSGLTIGAVCLVQDISESERLEQMRRDYVANISHELRTPLTGIRGMVEPLMDGIFDTEDEKRECYRVIYQETIRLEKLIREMLDMSRLQDGRLTIDMEMLEVNGIIESAVRRVSKIATDAGISLVSDINIQHIACMGNEDRILQVLTVFLDNALSFTPAGGTVTTFARTENGRVIMGVRDTGCGIEPKDLPYIWERFYKVDKSRMRTSGTGLGLAIAKLIVELMHGEIGVNTEPGKGAEFWFSLRQNDGTEP